ncbi:hypothetical protein EB75_28160 [Mycobacterium sp. ST-F2]|nr:hypothetical protein EB75_28160 [Mycobacterium sp. ST-F2]
MELLDRCCMAKRDMTDDESAEFGRLSGQVQELENELQRVGVGNADVTAIHRANAKGHAGGGVKVTSGGWAARAAAVLVTGESRGIASGSVDVPTLVETEVAAMDRPGRLIDLLTSRNNIQGNSFEFYRQGIRTNTAAPVADGAVKPTSIFTVAPIEDRCRVIAHLSEPVPIRLFADHHDLEQWLDDEMAEGVLDAIEREVISGDGTGEHMTGLLHTAGTTAVAFDTDMPTTLRSAVTAMQLKGVTPTGWVLHPNDAERIDLLRFPWGGAAAADAGFLLDGYQNGTAGSANVFGPTAPRVVSASVPEGTAVLGDWAQLRLYVREDVRLDIDAGGVLFTQNQAIVRAEARVGVGVLKPASFAVIDLTA